MRFGRKLHQYQVPAWANFYIHYDRLKGLVKDGQAAGGIPLSGSDHSMTSLTKPNQNSIDLLLTMLSVSTHSLQKRLPLYKIV